MAKSKGKSALRKTGRALKSAARGLLASGSEILGAGAMALNPVRRKVRNKYVDLVIKGRAKKTPDGWQVGKKTFAQGRGTVNVSSGYYLDRHTGTVYAKRERNATKKRKTIKRVCNPRRKTAGGKITKARAKASRVLRRKTSKKRRNVSEGFYDSSGFHPIRSSSDYDPGIAGETGRASRKTRSKKKVTAKRKAASTARTRSRIRTRKATTSRLAGRAIKKSAGLLKKRGRKRNNPSATEIRKEFAGSVSGSRDLFFPQRTPQGLAKLGKLVSITTEKGTIKPVHGSAWLCADTKEKLHIGSTTKADLFSGPARSFGKVTKVEYESSKPHLGYRGPIIWFHHMGESGGTRPTLHADGKGGLKFKGGSYRLTRRGIEN